MDTPDLTEAETDAIYLGIERARRCEQFVDRFAGCAAGEAECHCFAIGARIIEALRDESDDAGPNDPEPAQEMGFKGGRF